MSSLRITDNCWDVAQVFKQIIAKKRTYLKQMVFFGCILDYYTPRADTTPVSQHIKRIIFRACVIEYLSLKSFLDEFDSLDYIEFDACKFRSVGYNVRSNDVSDTDIKSMRLKNFSNSLGGKSRFDNITIISIYFTTRDLTRYFSDIDHNLIENTKSAFDMFTETLYGSKSVFLETKVKSLQELSLMV